MNDAVKEEIESFCYLGSIISKDGGFERYAWDSFDGFTIYSFIQAQFQKEYTGQAQSRPLKNPKMYDPKMLWFVRNSKIGNMGNKLLFI